MFLRLTFTLTSTQNQLEFVAKSVTIVVIGRTRIMVEIVTVEMVLDGEGLHQILWSVNYAIIKGIMQRLIERMERLWLLSRTMVKWKLDP